MLPVIKILGIEIHTYYIFLYSAIVVGSTYFIHHMRQAGYKASELWGFIIFLILGTIILSRAVFLLPFLFKIGLKEFITKTLQFWRGGGSIITVIISGLIILTFFFESERYRTEKFMILDFLSLTLPLGQAIGRIGCFMAGCCYGHPTDSFLGVVFTHPRSIAPLGIKLHPTQLYESLGCFLIFLFLRAKLKNKKFDGEIFSWYLVLYSSLRMFMEYFRGDSLFINLNRAGYTVLRINVPFIISIAGIISGYLIYRNLKKRSGRYPPGHQN
jgi:phosphatidylglycerol:prolipoprotein diacylglycerol transferase